MNDTAVHAAVEELNLLDSLRRDLWIKLPMVAVRDLGPAALTLAWIHKRTSTSTFRSVKNIIRGSEISLSVARKHLVTLRDEDWILNRGRHKRRTCTIDLTDKAKKAFADRNYGALPLWACCSQDAMVGEGNRTRNIKKRTFSWATQVLLSVVMARLMVLKAVVDKAGPGMDSHNAWISINNLGGSDRFKFPVTAMRELTGLSVESICKAKRELSQMEIVLLQSSELDSYGTHCLFPNEGFRIFITRQVEGAKLIFTTRKG